MKHEIPQGHRVEFVVDLDPKLFGSLSSLNLGGCVLRIKLNLNSG
jgi:hypothetical protein